MLVPTDPVPGAEGLDGLWHDAGGGHHPLESAHHVRRARFVRQSDRLLLIELIAAITGVVDISRGSETTRPLPHVALGRAGLLGQLGRGQRSCGHHRFEQTQLVADVDQCARQYGSEVAHCLMDIAHQLLFVNGHLRLLGRSLVPAEAYPPSVPPAHLPNPAMMTSSSKGQASSNARSDRGPSATPKAISARSRSETDPGRPYGAYPRQAQINPSGTGTTAAP